MKSNVDLTAYLPPFLTRYGEMEEILKAEEPEFALLWDNAQKALGNRFITTADEKGIANYERFLGLLSERSDSLEQRRARVMSKWLAKLPYTRKALTERLGTLCGGDFSLDCRFEEYTLKVLVHFRQYNDFLEVKKLLREMIPANIKVVSLNITAIKAEGAAAVYSGLKLSGKRRKIKAEVKNYGLE